MLPFRVTKDHIFVKTPFHDREYVKAVLNGVWSKAEKAYRFPRNIHVMRELADAYPELKTNPRFVETGKRLFASRSAMLQKKTLQDCWGDIRLRPYQRVDVEYLKALPAAGVFNEPRTGKTPTSIVLIRELGTFRNLVVSPASLVWNWAAEFEKWYPECRVSVIAGGNPSKREHLFDDFFAESIDKPCVLIISKDTLKRDIDVLSGFEFDVCLVDEAHYLRNYESAQSKAVCKVKAKRRYALTGTPSVKHATDIYGILRFLYPEKFTSYWQFVERYFIIDEDYFGYKQIGDVKPERREEFQELVALVSVQRTRKEVMAWLPDKTYQSIPVVMSEKQQKLYDRMEDEFVAYLTTLEDQDEDTVIDTSGVLAQLMRLRQICLDPRLLGFDVRGAKTDALLEWLEDNPEPVVIVSMFTSYLKLLKPEIEKLGRKVGMIHGEMENKEKHEMATAFQRGDISVLLCNIISAGTGFTLDRAETVVFTDRAWNPAENEQAEDRITPTTEDRNHKHTVLTFPVQHSVDKKIEATLARKESLTAIVRNGAKDVLERLIGKE